MKEVNRLKRIMQREKDRVNNIFAENMRALMDAREWTFREMEKKTDIPNSSLCYYSKGTVVVPLAAAVIIAEAFGLTVDAMVKNNAADIANS